jgi:hypothetical protein
VPQELGNTVNNFGATERVSHQEKTMIRKSLMIVALLSLASQVHAQARLDSMFDEMSRDFGSVPRGQQLMHPFRIVNNTNQPVRISGVSVSCNCVSTQILKNTLQPGEETAVIATMNTSVFINTRTVTIYVRFDQPRFQEVRLWVSANSREDVQFNPANIAFGVVKRGAEPETKMVISFLGGSTQVTEIKSESNYVTPHLKEVQRPNGGTAYEISAKLRPDTPAGKWYTDIWLTTNNPSMQRLRVPVTVEVESPLTVNPSTVSLGQVKAGTESDRKVIIRGLRPFRITGITGTDGELQVKTTSNESKAVHVLTVTLSPRQAGQPFTKNITVQTDLGNNNDINFSAKAEVIP